MLLPQIDIRLPDHRLEGGPSFAVPSEAAGGACVMVCGATVHLKSTNKHVTGDIHFGKTHLTNIVLWSKEGNCPTGGMAQFRILAEIRPSIAEHFTY